MRTVIAKIDDKTAEELDKLAGDSSRSDIIRRAIRHYIAASRIAERRRQVEEYMQSSAEQDRMRELAESDMEDAEMILRREETQR